MVINVLELSNGMVYKRKTLNSSHIPIKVERHCVMIREDNSVLFNEAAEEERLYQKENNEPLLEIKEVLVIWYKKNRIN